MAGIKFHAAIDVAIRGNHIYRNCRGIWLDWMAQGTRVTSNLLHDNAAVDLFFEVDHGPFLVDNNLFLSRVGLLDISEGDAFAHNLFAGKIVSHPDLGRMTPYHQSHSTTIAGMHNVAGGDNRFYNNIFVGKGESATPGKAAGDDPERAGAFGLWVYNARTAPLSTGGNVYYNGAELYAHEEKDAIRSGDDPKIKIAEENGNVYLSLTLGGMAQNAKAKLVTSELLGVAKICRIGI